LSIDPEHIGHIVGLIGASGSMNMCCFSYSYWSTGSLKIGCGRIGLYDSVDCLGVNGSNFEDGSGFETKLSSP